ncbi:hypothetical protein [Mycobacteroides salmoniphilum]|uniref:Uncharacterized protein n=1 Tax=Mycobacteroides salmoniphilum TaxID=404941 RepID=A0A4R8T1F0_9MYCO|nr:hypothetical protein [Mycobacteroides salmoniphilum]TEA09218.1 hypothetical protein CCUG60884_00208 [Mycobacteroides salmoniphilum]
MTAIGFLDEEYFDAFDDLGSDSEDYRDTVELSGTEVFVQEYEWFKSFGMSDDAIARRFCISVNALEKRRERAGLTQHAYAKSDVGQRLMALIDSGGDFDHLDFPFVFAPNEASNAIKIAVRAGRIVRVGDRKDPMHCGSARISVYRAVDQDVPLPPEPVEMSRDETLVGVLRLVGRALQSGSGEDERLERRPA